MSYISWYTGLFAGRSKVVFTRPRKRPSPIKLESLEDRTVPAGSFDPNFHAVASLPPSRAAQMETAMGPVQVHSNGDAAAAAPQKTHITFGGAELSPDAVRVRPYRNG